MTSLSQVFPAVPFFSFPYMSPTARLYPQFPHTNSLSKLPLFLKLSSLPFLQNLSVTCPFKTRPPEDPEAKLLISYILWTKAELQAIVKDFPKGIKDSHIFAEEFNIVIQTYQPGFSDLYQPVHMLVSEGQAKH